MMSCEEEPRVLTCPITRMMFRHPVIVVETGYTYEKQAILEHIHAIGPKDPMTNMMISGDLVFNRAIHDSVNDWLARNPHTIPEGWESRVIPEFDRNGVMKRLQQALEEEHALDKRTMGDLCRLIETGEAWVATRDDRVTELHMSGCGMTEIPPEIFRFSSLKYLYFDNNHVKNIPPKIFSKLTKLEVLNLSNNELKDIPIELCKLKNLRLLDLSHNQISHLPDDIVNFRNLHELRLSHNRLTELPTRLPEALRRLFVEGNNITSFPKCVEYVSRLEK